MKNLRKNSFFILIFTTLIFSCQNVQTFKMKNHEKEIHTVEIDSNRIIQECHFMNAEKENQWRHQYVLYMLDAKNEVIPVYYPTNQDKSTCSDQLKVIEKILKKESPVRLCVRDRLEKIDDGSAPEIHSFGPLGKHESPYHGLTFDTICNSKKCYSISDTWTYTCPGFKK